MSITPPNERPRRDDLSAPLDGPLTERERRYRTLFGAMDEGLCVIEMVFDSAGRPSDYSFLEFNDAFERMTGIPAEDALAGRTMREMCPTLEEHWFETYGRVATTGEPVRFENGAEAMGRWFEVHAFRIGGPGSLEVGILFKDVSRRRLDEIERERLIEELETERGKLRTLFELAPAFIAVLRGRDLVFEYVNEAYYQTVGHRPVIGLPLAEAIPEVVGGGEGRDYDRLLRGVMDDGLALTFRERPVMLQRTPGAPLEERFLDLSYQPLREADGRIGGILAHGVDVTEGVCARAEAQTLAEGLQRQTALWDAALSNIADYVFVFDLDLRFRYANQALLGLWGLPLEAIVGRNCADLSYPPEVEEQLERNTRHVIATRERAFDSTAYTSPQGEAGYFEYVLAPVLAPDGSVQGVAGSSRNVTARVGAEAALRESEETFRTVFEQAPDDAILVMGLDRTLTAWNPAAERITGWSAAEALGTPADLIFTAEDRAKGAPEAEVAEAARFGKSEDERWHVRKDGSRFWGSGTMNALHDGEGRVRGYLKVFRDATERYEEAQTLAFLSLLTEAVIDERGPERILETVERMLGQYLGGSRVTYGEFAPDEDTFTIRSEWGPGAPSVVGTHSLSSFGEAAVKTLRAGRTYVVYDAEKELAPALFEAARRVDAVSGITVPVIKEGRLAALCVVNDRVPREWTDDEIGLVQQVADRMSSEIERARAEEALRRSEERFRQLVDLSPSTVWFGETDGGLSYISQDFYDATGLTPETALPSGWVSTVHPEDLPRVAEEWAARRDETLYDTEFRIRHRSGEYRWISARAIALRDVEGRVTGWLGSNSDIHERKTAEATLQERVEDRTQQLQAAVKEAEGFNYSISHDLRTPLRAMVATSGILLEEAGPELSEEHRGLLVRQAENAKRLGRLIDELLRLSRLARVAVKREPLDMTAKALAVAAELEQSGGMNGCRVEVQPGMTAQGDAALVRSVLQNLVGNACKFSPAGGTVRVRQKGAVFSVADEGVGFDMAFAPKIFHPFERLVSETEFPGTGIGLANVKRIVERHRGGVWAESEPGKGATFYFTLDRTETPG